MAGINLSSGFNASLQKPLDLRTVVDDITARDNIDSVKRFEGLEVYVIDSDGSGNPNKYRLENGTTNTDWVETGGTTINSLVDIGNVNISSVADGHIVEYDGTNSEWVNQVKSNISLSSFNNDLGLSNITTNGNTTTDSITIGSTDAPSSVLDVYGSINIGRKLQPSITFNRSDTSGIGRISYSESNDYMRYYCEANNAHAFLNGQSEPLFYILDSGGTTHVGVNKYTSLTETLHIGGGILSTGGRVPTLTDTLSVSADGNYWYNLLYPVLNNSLTGEAVVSGSLLNSLDYVISIHKVVIRNESTISIFGYDISNLRPDYVEIVCSDGSTDIISKTHYIVL